jgi:hypothetical protein
MTKRMASRAALASIVFALSACGGNNDGVAVTPPPAPPPPPPVSGYTRFADLTGTTVVQTAAIKYSGTIDSFQNFQPQSFGGGSTITYNAADNSYTVTPVGGTAVTFTQSNLITLSSGVAEYVNGVNRLFFNTPASGGVALSYTRLGSFQTPGTGGRTNIELLVGGVPTRADDMPRAGAAAYTVAIDGTAVRDGTPITVAGNSSASFNANFATGVIDLALRFGGTSSAALATANGTGTISSTGSGFAGIFTSGVNITSGSFNGGFFGPQAAEVGFNYSLVGPSFSAVGQGAGVKVTPPPPPPP